MKPLGPKWYGVNGIAESILLWEGFVQMQVGLCNGGTKKYQPLISFCCGKQELPMSPLRKQGPRAKKLDSRFLGNDKYCFRNRN